MKALVCGKDGACGVAEAEWPLPRKGQLLVKVMAASFNRGDYALRKNLHLASSPLDIVGAKSIVGADVAGVVVAVAPDVARFRVGDEVCAVCPGLSGAMAEYAVVDAKWTAPVPAGMGVEQAATIPSSGVTALAAVKKADVDPGKKILVCGASGGVGQYAVLLAAASGAQVDAACRQANFDAARGCGAIHTFDYAEGLGDVPNEEYDAVIGVNGRFSASEYARILKPSGVYVLVGQDSLRPSALSLPLRGRRLRAALFFSLIGKGGLDEAVSLVAESPNHVAIASCNGMTEAAAMLVGIASSRPKGKTVVVL